MEQRRNMKTEIEIKTLRDLPQEMKDMYGIKDGSESIYEPAFVGLTSHEYSIEEGEVAYSIRVENKAHITLYKNFQMLHISIF